MSREFGRTELDDRLRAKRHLRKENRRDDTGRGSATESTSTRDSAKSDAKRKEPDFSCIWNSRRPGMRANGY